VLNLYPCAGYRRNCAFFRYERERGRTSAGLLVDFPILMLTIAIAFVAHLIEIALWAALFVICGEFKDFAFAYYHSAVNYSTLGYGGCRQAACVKALRVRVFHSRLNLWKME
jgi:hypothetical protein